MTNIRCEFVRLPHCPVCSNETRKLLFPIQESAVYECARCGLKYLDPCLSPEAMARAYESAESLSGFHDFHEGYYDYGDLAIKSKTLDDYVRGLDLLERCLVPGLGQRSILDVGFGNGFFLAVAKKNGWQVQGIDTSAKNVQLAGHKFGLELACGTLENWNPGSGRYHAISFWDVIEHFPDPHPALQKARELLIPGGLILVGIPDDRSLIAFLGRWLYRLSFGQFKKGVRSFYFLEHVAYYRLRSLEALFKINGFELAGHFYTSTDLARYKLPRQDKLIASILLGAGCFLGFENRLVAAFQKK